MSLIAWYKMDGNIDNSISGSYFTNMSLISGSGQSGIDGIFGRCTVMNAAVAYSGNNTIKEGSYSVCSWGKLTASGDCMLFSFTNTNGPNLYFSGSTISWNTGDGTANPFKNGSTNVSLPSLNIWHHFAVTTDSGKREVKLYIDGEYKGSATYKNVACSRFVIGNYAASTTTYGFKGHMCDFKIYDNIISLKEIKDLANAQFLNLRFNSSFEATRNFESRETVFSDVADGATCSFISQLNGTGAYLGVSSAQSYYGSKSMKMVGGSRACRNLTVSNVGKKYTASAMVYSETAGAYMRIELNGGSHNWTGSTGNTHTGSGWELLYVVSSQILSSTSLHYFIYPNNTTIYVDGIMLEEKDHPTDYVGTTREFSLIDNSGYGNNAEITPYSMSNSNIPAQSLDNRKGRLCVQFNNLSKVGSEYQYFYIPSMYVPENFTLSYWSKGGVGSSHQVIENIYPIGWVSMCEFGPDNGVNQARGFIWYPKGATDYTKISYNTNTYDNNWHHIAIVYNGSNLKFYEDGVLKHTQSNVTFNLSKQYEEFRIGSAWSESYGGFTGYMDDIRLYARALPIESVKELYETALEIDNLGNLYTSNIVESTISNPSANTLGFNNKGEAKCVVVNEAFTIGNTYILDDSNNVVIVQGEWNTTQNKMQYKGTTAFTCFSTAFPTSWDYNIDINKYKTRVVLNNINNNIFCNEINEV